MNKRPNDHSDIYQNKRPRANAPRLDGPDIHLSAKVFKICPAYQTTKKLPEYFVGHGYYIMCFEPGPKLLAAYVVGENGEIEDVIYRVLTLYGNNRDWNGHSYSYRALLDERNVGGTMHMVFADEPKTPVRFDIVSSRRIESLDDELNPAHPETQAVLEERSKTFNKYLSGVIGTAYSN